MFPNRALYPDFMRLRIFWLMSSSLITNSFAVLIWLLIMEKTASAARQFSIELPTMSLWFSTNLSPLSRVPSLTSSSRVSVRIASFVCWVSCVEMNGATTWL